MKIRIQGNSIRIRLSRTEVEKLCLTGHIEDHTSFATTKFGYSVKSDANSAQLTASYSDNLITLLVPESYLKNWPENSTIGFEANMPVDDDTHLYLLLEKDFKCLDNTTEDQSDNYENPNKSC
jgi:hypothetical protein